MTGLTLDLLWLGFNPRSKPSNQADQQRKSERWFVAFHDTTDAIHEIGGKTRVTTVCDREADRFGLFNAQRQLTWVELLVRTKHNRNLTPDSREENNGGRKLFDVMCSGKPDGRIDIEVEGVSKRPKSNKK